MICTTIEQSKKLLELGISQKTADMFWDTLLCKKPECQVNNHHYIDEYDDEHRFPAWSLTALLELIRSTEEHVKLIVSSLNGYKLSIEQHRSNTTYSSPIDAAVDMIEWLVKDGHIIKEK